MMRETLPSQNQGLSMQVCCPVCETQIDYETVAVTGNSFLCPSCETDISIDGLVTSALVSEFDDGPTRTMTVESMKEVEIDIGSTLGNFEIIEEVGKGGFGSVYKARDQRLDRIVALKVPKASAASKLDAGAFLREAQLAASVRDPNIVVVHEIGKEGETSYICSDFIEGTTLKTWYRETKPSINQCCELLIRIAKSLHKAHEAELIHRDLKPANILMDSESTPFITDFGLAKRIETDDKGNVLTSQRSTGRREIVGTPAYMSPEQAIGDLTRVNKKTDIYSLGVILYELVVGQRPFNGTSASIIQDVLYADPENPTTTNKAISKVLSAIIAKAMSKNQNERFGTALEFADELQRFLKGEPTLTSPLSISENIAYRVKKHRIAIVASLMVVIAVGITAVLSPLGAGENASIPFVIPPAEKIPMAQVLVSTKPERATIAIVPIDPVYRTPMRAETIQPTGLTPLTVELPVGEFIVEAFMPGLKGGGVYEVRRTVSKVMLDSNEPSPFATIPLVEPLNFESLVRVEGGEILVKYVLDEDAEQKPYKVSPFYIQETEVTCESYMAVMKTLPSHRPEVKSDNEAHYPVTNLHFLDAVQFAEKTGMRIPDFEEYYFAATNGGKTDTPWGPFGEVRDLWKFGPVKNVQIDKTNLEISNKPIFGLFSNVPEITVDSIVDEEFEALGIADFIRNQIRIVGTHGSYDLPGVAPKPNTSSREFYFHPKELSLSKKPIGFRCVKSAAPRFIDVNKIEN